VKPLAGRVAVVTGGSRGIGRGCAIELGAAGATVYVTGRSDAAASGSLPGTVRETAAEVDAAGGRGIPAPCDHRDDDQVAELFRRVEGESGRLDLLVNNAFLIPRELTSGRPFWEVPISNWDDMIDVGLRSAYVASWHAAHLMTPRGRGLIANISSSGAAEYAWHVVYGVGKCALDRLTADTAHELRPHGVTVVSIWPGLVLTERTRSLVGEGRLDFDGAESQRFTGRAIAHLAADPEVQVHSGRALTSRSLAEHYGFVDVDGGLPRGPLHERPGGLE
jgi:NAD(P)-dependent dehydrogenase (short-subunit alcohol dehydrogenase family)